MTLKKIDDLYSFESADSYIPTENLELWGIVLPYQFSRPNLRQLVFPVGSFKAGQTRINNIEHFSLSSFTLFKGDVLYCEPLDQLGVIAETVVIEPYQLNSILFYDTFTHPTGSLSIQLIDTYALLPLHSIAEGGIFSIDGGVTEGFNKNNGLWASKTCIRKDCELSLTGSYYKEDRFAIQLEQENLNANRNVWLQTRYNPLVETKDANGNTLRYGQGVGASEAMFTIVFVDTATSTDREGLIEIDCLFECNSYPNNYRLLPEGGVNYCPQANRAFYNISYIIIPEYDSADYCEQDATGFYDFAQAP